MGNLGHSEFLGVLEGYLLWVAEWDSGKAYEASFQKGLHLFCRKLHHCNFSIWKNEDVARRTDVENGEIARVKRSIDQFNQKRNDIIESIDLWLLEHHFGDLAEKDLPMRTETPGSVLDRLSILSLKIHFMGKQTEREDTDQAHIEACQIKLVMLKEQHADLQNGLLQMISDLEARRIRFKVYRQFKMYNDPNLNPQIYMNRK